MLGHIVELIVQHHLCRVEISQIGNKVGHGVGFQLHVGLDATTVAHLSAITGIEHLRQRVRDMLTIASTTLLVVNRLDTTATGNIVFRGGHLQVGVVGHVKRYLYQSLPVCTRTYYNCTV